MGANTAYRQLAGRLKNSFLSFGFRWKPREEAFVSEGEGTAFKVYLPFLRDEPIYEFSFSFGIRLDEVEEIYHQFSSTAMDYRSLTCTSVTRLSFLVRSGADRFRYSNAEEFEVAVLKAEQIFANFGLNFFQLHAAIDVLAKRVNEVYVDERFCITQHPSRALHGLILWWMAGFAGLDDLGERYYAEMKDFPHGEIERLKNLMAFLHRAH